MQLDFSGALRLFIANHTFVDATATILIAAPDLISGAACENRHANSAEQ